MLLESMPQGAIRRGMIEAGVELAGKEGKASSRYSVGWHSREQAQCYISQTEQDQKGEVGTQ